MRKSTRAAIIGSQAGTTRNRIYCDPGQPWQATASSGFGVCAYDRWPEEKPVPWKGEWPVVPEICVEVVSPTDLHTDLADKVRAYLSFGVIEVWIVNPVLRTISVHRGVKDISVFTVDDKLTSPEILPGVELSLAEVFRDVHPDQFDDHPEGE